MHEAGTSSDCFALRLGSSGEVVVESVAPLPHPRAYSCHGSDGSRLAVAGGSEATSFSGISKAVWVLDGLTTTWGVAAVELSPARRHSAGLLLGDLLVCFGG